MGLLEDEVVTPKFDDLVGEGKKYKDTNELFAAFVEKDTLLSQTLAEKTKLETDLRAGKTLSEMLEDLTKRPANRNEEPMEPTHRELGPKGDEPKDSVDIAAEVRKAIEAETTRSRREANVERAKQKLKELYGADYKKTLEDVATSLGLPTKFLDDMAATSPDGFVQTIVAQRKPDPNHVVAPPANQNAATQAQPSSVRKNHAYYRELRKKEPNLYMTRRIQTEMHNEAMKQGDAFYT
jgi:hypothetical protein